MSTQCNITVRKSLLVILTLIICISFLFVSCPLAPPEDPAKGLNPYLSPAAPTGLAATNGLDSSITIKWEESPNATSYEVWGIPSSDFGTIDVPPFYKADGDNAGYDPAIKGFQFFADVEETSYTITNLPSDSAFVFCLRAIRDLGEQIPVSSRLLYSSPSSYVEGSTKGAIALQVLATTKNVKLLWNVGNLFKVLPDVSGAQEPLYACSFDVLYRVHGTSQFVALPEATGLTSFSYNIPTSSTVLDTRNTYDFQVRMTIMTSTGTNVYVTSSSISVQPEENLVPEPVTAVNVSQGQYADCVEVSWQIPPVPVGFSPDSVFIIERRAENETEWETVLDQSSTQFSNHDNPLYDAPSESYVWKDTSAVDNTLYKYRVWNGYRFDQVIFMQDEQDDSGANIVSESPGFGWKIWKINGAVTLEESNITYDDVVVDSVRSVEITLSWEYGQEFNSNITKWVLEERCWNQENGQTTTSTEEITPIVIDGYYTYTKKLILASGDSLNYQKTYSYTLKIELVNDSTVYQSVPVEKETSLGKAQIAYFDSVTATKDLAQGVQLTWNLHKEKVEAGAASGDVNIWSDIITNTTGAITYAIMYSDAVSTDVPVDITSCTFNVEPSPDQQTATVSCWFVPNSDDDRSYRVSAQLRDTSAPFNSSETVIGRPLSTPTGLIAEKGISDKAIMLSWDVPEIIDNVVYRLYRKTSGIDEAVWQLVETFDDPSVANYSDTYLANTVNAGTLYDYALDAYNKIQSSDGSINTNKSTSVQGCLFGAKLTNVQASDATDASKIVITWNGVEGATKYKVMRRLKGSSDAFYSVTAQVATTSNTTYTAEDTGIVKLGRSEQNPYPLSAQYDYIVQPIREVEGEETITVLEKNCPIDSGFLFAPPENIKATVSQSVTSIDISWDAVKMLDGDGNLVDDPEVFYLVYSIDGKTGEPTNSASWSLLKTVNGTSTTQSSLNNAEKYYNVVAVKQVTEDSQIRSEFQKFFPDGKSYCYGATLNAPATLTVARDKTKGITKVSWKAVPNVTTYIVYGLPGIEAGKELEVSSVTIPGNNNGQDADTVGFIELDGEGAYTYCLDYEEYESTYQPITISSVNIVEGTEYKSGRSISAYFDLTSLEMLNIMNSIVQYVIRTFDGVGHFNGDWWPTTVDFSPKMAKDSFESSTVTYYTGGFGNTPETCNIVMSEQRKENIYLSLSTQDSIALRPKNSSSGSSAGTQPLQYIGYDNTGLIKTSFMDANSSPIPVTLKYKNIDATASSNSADKFELTVNGAVVPSSDFSGTIVMPY